MLRVGRIVEATEAEGPGLRAAVWLQGCTLGCRGCCNPELLGTDGGTEMAPADLATRLAGLDVEGTTWLGGEPLQQAEPLAECLAQLRRESAQGIMLFTGYRFDQAWQDPVRRAVLSRCDLVVAGPFMANRTPDPRRWIGSTNQTVHFLTDRYAALRERWDSHRAEIEIHIGDGEILVNGTPLEWSAL